MIVTYKINNREQAEVDVERIDLRATAVAKYGGDIPTDTTTAESGDSEKSYMSGVISEKIKQFHISSGETHGEAEMSITYAPLIFPTLDAAAAVSPAAEGESNSEGIGSNIKTKSKSASKSVNDYYDRRA